MTTVKDKKGCFKCISSRRKTMENVELQLNEGIEKAELWNATFASAFTVRIAP